MLLSAVFATASLLVSTALPYQSFLPKFVENVWNGAASSFSNLYHLPGFITGNVIDGVKVVHYGVGNWTDIVSGLGFLPQGDLNASAVIDIKGISKIRHPYQIGASLQIGGAVIPVEGSSSNRSVVIGDAGSRGSDFIGNATGIIVSTDNLDENGFLNGTWGYMPLRTESIQSHTGSALVKVTGSGGEKQQVVIPVVRPVIPTIVGNDSGSTQVQRLTVLNILQSNLINVLSFLLQTSPIISNAKMLAVVETLHNKLLSAQLNVDFILPQLEQLMSLSLQEQLEIVLKSFISIVEPDFGFQLQYLINYLKEPKVADLIFTHQIPNLTGGIDQSWALPWVLAPPSYNPADANSFMNNALGQLLIQTIKSSDKNAIKYNIYLILTTVPLGLEPRTVRQIRNLASILYALNSNIWEMISQQLPNIPTTNVYDGLKAFLQLVINIQGVPQQVTFIIKNIIHAIPDTTAVTTKVTQIPTRVTLFPQPENSHPIYPQPQDPSKSKYKSQRPPEPTQLPYSSHQLEPQNHQPEFPSQNKSENELQSQPNYPPQHQPKPQNQFHSQYPHQNEFYQPQTKTPLPQNPQQPETEHKSQPQYGKIQQPQQTTRQSEPQPSAQYQSQSPLPPYQLEPQNATQPGIQHQPLYPPHETELQRQNQSQLQPQYTLPLEPESQPTQLPLNKSQSQPQHPPYQTQPQPQSQPLNATRQEIQHQSPQYPLHEIETKRQNQSQSRPQYALPQEPESQPTQLPLNKSQSQPQHPPYQTQPQPQSLPLNATRQEIQHQPPQYSLHAIELQSQNQSQPQPQYVLPQESEPQSTQLPLIKSQSQPQHPPYQTQPQPQSQPLNSTRQEIQHQSPQYPLHEIETKRQNQSQSRPQYALPQETESQSTQIPLIKSQSQPQQPPYQTQPQPQSQPLNATRQEIQHQPPQYTLREIELQSQNQSQLQSQSEFQPPPPYLQQSEPQQPSQYQPQTQPQLPPHKTDPQYATRQPEPQHQHSPHETEPQSQNQSQPQHQEPPQPQQSVLQTLPQPPSQSQHLTQPESEPHYSPRKPEIQRQTEPQNATKTQYRPQDSINVSESQGEPQLQPGTQAEPQHGTPSTTSMSTFFPVDGILDAPSERDLQNPTELLPFCSGYEGCPSIDKIHYLFSKKSVTEFILNLNINVSMYPNKASLLLYIFQRILSQVQLQTDEVTAIKHYIRYLTTEMDTRTIEGLRQGRFSTNVTDILTQCIDKSLYCIVLKEIGTILHNSSTYCFLQDRAYNPAVYPTKEAYLQSILETLVSRNVLSVKDLTYVDLYLQYVKTRQQPSIVVSGDKLSDILKYLIQPSDTEEQKLFEILTNFLSKANIKEILSNYKVDLSISAGQLLKSMLKYALSHPQVTQNQQLRQIIQHSVSKISPSSIGINMEDFGGPLDAQTTRQADIVAHTEEETWSPVTYKQTIDLNDVLRAVDKDRLGELGVQQLIEYFAKEFNTDILIQGFQFWKYNTKGTWLKELLNYILNKTEVSPSSRALLSRVIPLIRTTGVGGEALEYIS